MLSDNIKSLVDGYFRTTYNYKNTFYNLSQSTLTNIFQILYELSKDTSTITPPLPQTPYTIKNLLNTQVTENDKF